MPSINQAICGLAAYNFIIAAMQTGFGPFVNLALIGGGWSQTDVGFALSIGTIAALALQLPGGALVDLVHQKRAILAAATILTGASAAAFCFARGFVTVMGAELLHSAAATLITPAIAAVTLAAFGPTRLSASLGGNTRWQSLGSAGAALLLGAVATADNSRTAFLVVAAMSIPAVWVLRWIAPSAPIAPTHPAMLHPKARREAGHRFWNIYLQRHIHTFAIAVLLFSLANAAMLPLAVNALAARGRDAGLMVSAAIIVSQLVVAAVSPALGRRAESHGRRPILLLGFGILPVKGLLLALIPGPAGLLLAQACDGISGAVLGIMIPLMAADMTRHTSFMNLAINSLALAAGLGGAVSNSAAGWLADQTGTRIATLALVCIALAALAVLAFTVPETHPTRLPDKAQPARMRQQPGD